MQVPNNIPIANRVTGDRFVVLETGAEELRIRFRIAPGSAGAPLHFHRSMSETFHILEGAMTLELDGKGALSERKAGSEVTIPPGRLHSFSNRATGQWLVFEAHIRPPMGFLTFLLGFYGLAEEGKTDGAGTPRNPVALLRLLSFGDVWLPGIPMLLQRGLFAAVERLSFWLGQEGELVRCCTRMLAASVAAEAREARP